MAAETKDELLFLANLCDKSRLYRDMVDAMKKLVGICPKLDYEERYMLTTAYKGVVSSLRKPWRAICAIEQRAFSDITEAQRDVSILQITESYREELEAELLATCRDALEFVEETLLPQTKDDAEANAFYLKMKGDFYRYMAEIATGEDRSAVVELAKETYQKSYGIATAKLKPSNPTRLGVALNLSVFYHEIVKSVEDSIQTIKKALEEALAEIKTLPKKDVPEDSFGIIEAMRDNLDLWTPMDPQLLATK